MILLFSVITYCEISDFFFLFKKNAILGLFWTYISVNIGNTGHNLPDKSCVADTAMQIELA